ncbi:hypothetical protein EOS93_28875 [Rhizobium sp. RMa-01]|nr:hypothetical protein EOS93_28875 [Rhizobium sp. RMa-01]
MARHPCTAPHRLRRPADRGPSFERRQFAGGCQSGLGHPLQVTLAHRNQSHPLVSRAIKRGESDIPTLQKQDTSTLRLQNMSKLIRGATLSAS